jgi:hypothetical protein
MSETVIAPVAEAYRERLVPLRRSSARGARGLRFGWRPQRWWIELLTILLGYGLYEIVQGAAPVHRAVAFVHAHQVARWEAVLGVDAERSINRFANSHTWIALGTGYYYDSLHYLVTPSVLLWLWFFRRSAYGRWRSALVGASTASLAVFWAWAVAPPRLATPGIVDTLVVHHIMGTVESDGSEPLVNAYAAMPSLHVGWAVWCAAAIAGTASTRWRHLAWLYPLGTTFVVMATGNHYLLDGVGGLLVLLLGMVLTAHPARTIAPTGISAMYTNNRYSSTPVAAAGADSPKATSNAVAPASAIPVPAGVTTASVRARSTAKAANTTPGVADRPAACRQRANSAHCSRT